MSGFLDKIADFPLCEISIFVYPDREYSGSSVFIIPIDVIGAFYIIIIITLCVTFKINKLNKMNKYVDCLL